MSTLNGPKGPSQPHAPFRANSPGRGFVDPSSFAPDWLEADPNAQGPETETTLGVSTYVSITNLCQTRLC